jgi:hypothetical protein
MFFRSLGEKRFSRVRGRKAIIRNRAKVKTMTNMTTSWHIHCPDDTCPGGKPPLTTGEFLHWSNG